jgi:hypothetical protein
MSDLASAGDIMPTVYIRFNPDHYRDSDGKKRVITLERRFETLKEQIDKWLNIETEQDHYITTVYLYYDKCDVIEESFIPCDWDEKKEADSMITAFQVMTMTTTTTTLTTTTSYGRNLPPAKRQRVDTPQLQYGLDPSTIMDYCNVISPQKRMRIADMLIEYHIVTAECMAWYINVL